MDSKTQERRKKKEQHLEYMETRGINAMITDHKEGIKKHWTNYTKAQREAYRNFYLKEFKEKNKEGLKKYRNEYQGKMVRCDVCGVDVRYDGYARHTKTKKHLKNT